MARVTAGYRPGVTIRIGTSGWSYPSWRGDFYPDALPHREELAYLAGRTSSAACLLAMTCATSKEMRG